MVNSAVAPIEDLIEEVLEKSSTLVLFHCREYTASGYFRRQAAPSRSATRPSLEGALLALLGREPTKRCPACGQNKIKARFSSDSSRYDSLTPVCRPCHSTKRRRAA